MESTGFSSVSGKTPGPERQTLQKATVSPTIIAESNWLWSGSTWMCSCTASSWKCREALSLKELLLLRGSGKFYQFTAPKDSDQSLSMLVVFRRRIGESWTRFMEIFRMHVHATVPHRNTTVLQKYSGMLSYEWMFQIVPNIPNIPFWKQHQWMFPHVF